MSESNADWNKTNRSLERMMYVTIGLACLITGWNVNDALNDRKWEKLVLTGRVAIVTNHVPAVSILPAAK